MASLPSAKRLFCPHCAAEVPKATWYRHFNEYYDSSTNTWSTAARNLESDFDFGSDCDSDCDDIQCTQEENELPAIDSFPETDSYHYEEPMEMEDIDAAEENDGVELWESDEDGEDSMQQSEDAFPGIKIMWSISIFLLTWQALFRIPDTAIAILLKFIKFLFHTLVEYSNSRQLHNLSEVMPDTIPKTQTMLSINREDFQKFIVCQKCDCTYDYNECFPTRRMINCSYVPFPRHPHAHMRVKCYEPLLKVVKTTSGKTLFAPHKVFLYKSPIDLIKELIKQPGTLDLLNHWRKRSLVDGVMTDIYDGAIWKSFLYRDGNEILASRYGIGLAINVDWFQPYTHVAYSVGVIYICVLNLPRHLRYLKDNIFIVGIIPGPHEPKLHINSFLEPLVRDLTKLWKGITMATPEGEQKVYAVLLCAACDIPASRKLGGFVGHNALKGCSRCLKSFPTEHFGEASDYSGFDRSTWPSRSLAVHQEKGMSWRHARTLSDRNDIERNFGVRYTELLRLPYFDTSRFIIVDPMHNMLLGNAKHITNIWKKMGILSDSNFDLIQSYVNKFIIPTGVGRIPYKISSKFSSFTADQWKNWTLIFSGVVLKSVIPEDHYKCWCIFIDACRIMCSRAISNDSVTKLDGLIINFCQTFQLLYGASACTPNLHLNCHLMDCIIDYGPASAFWVFAYERLNGMLGSIPNNHRAVEIQMMRKFLATQQTVRSFANCDDPELHRLFEPFTHRSGSLHHEELPDLPLSCDLTLSNVVKLSDACHFVPPIKEGCLDKDEHTHIENNLKLCFGTAYKRTLLLYRQSRAIRYNGELHGSLNTVHSNSSLVQVKCGDDIKPAFVLKYIKLSTIITLPGCVDDKCINIYVAAISWLKEHPNKTWFNHPIEIWRRFSECHYPDTFVTISRIVCRCAHLTEEVEFSNRYKEIVTIVVPLNNYYGL